MQKFGQVKRNHSCRETIVQRYLRLVVDCLDSLSLKGQEKAGVTFRNDFLKSSFDLQVRYSASWRNFQREDARTLNTANALSFAPILYSWISPLAKLNGSLRTKGLINIVHKDQPPAAERQVAKGEERITRDNRSHPFHTSALHLCLYHAFFFFFS